MSLQKNYRIQHFNADFLRNLQAPYVLLANHVTNEDPFIYNILCPYPVTWIIGKSIERDSKFPWLLRCLRCISRSKEMSDLDTIKKIREWIDDGEVVGIFPEGQTSFSGVSHPMSEATAKLLRFLKVPVVALRNEGGYFAQPRWAWQRRCSKKGQGPSIQLHYQLLFDSEQIKTAKLDEINAKIQSFLHYDPYRRLQESPTEYSPPILDRGLEKQNLAESMELLFYACLVCRSPSSLGAMESEGMVLKCKSCGAAWRVSEDSHFLQIEEPKRIKYNLEQYYQGQLQLLRQLAAEGKLELEQIFSRLRCYSAEDQALRLRQGGSSRYSDGLLKLNAQGLNLSQGDQILYHFPLTKIFATHVFKHNTWEFHAPDMTAQLGNGSALFVLEFPRKTDSAFLLLDSLKTLQQEAVQEVGL